MSKFFLGKLVITPGAEKALSENDQTWDEFLISHAYGDWGMVSQESWQANDSAVSNGNDMILSSYLLNNGEKLWIITEADRSVTTFLLPEEW